jgi:hypothetical protein
LSFTSEVDAAPRTGGARVHQCGFGIGAPSFVAGVLSSFLASPFFAANSPRFFAFR